MWRAIREKPERGGRDHRGHVPSDLCDYHVWKEYQAENPEYLCYVPQAALPPIPVMLLYEPFSSLTRNLKDGPPEAKDLKFAKKFWDALHDPKYVTEHWDSVYKITTTLIGDYLGQEPQPYRMLSGGVRADGILMVNNVGVLFFKWKAESGNAGDPLFENLDYLRRAGYEVPQYQTYSLAINIEGRLLHLLAASLENDGRVWAEPVAVTTCYGNFDALKRTAQIWRAVRLFVEEVQQKGRLPRLRHAPIPWPLQGLPNAVQLHDHKLLFTFLNSEGKTEAAKFASSYCAEAHRAWQENGNAPVLKDVKQVGAEWWMITMEYLSPESGWVSAVDVVQDIRESEKHVTKLKCAIRTAVTGGHSRGFVHGDLRACNIMVRASAVQDEDGFPEYEVRIVDFDWAGKQGVAVYPRPMNPNVEWPPGAGFGKLIKEEHDIYFIDRLVEQLEEKTEEVQVEDFPPAMSFLHPVFLKQKSLY